MTPSASNSANLYSLSYSEARTYLWAALFVVANIALPQLVHLIPNGGHIWLPIFFFTLVGAFKYGWKTGLLVAVASPLANSLLFGMPAAAALPLILFKSVTLAVAAAWAAAHWRKASLAVLAAVVLSCQLLGTAAEWLLTSSLPAALASLRTAIPGMLLQVVGGWAIINHVIRK